MTFSSPSFDRITNFPVQPIMSSFTDYGLMYFMLMRWFILILPYVYSYYTWPLIIAWKFFKYISRKIKGVETEDLILNIPIRFLKRSKKTPYQVEAFWLFYFLYASPTQFKQDYMSAWRQKYQDWSISILLDNGSHQEVPCGEYWGSDEKLMKHLISFYNVTRSSGIPFEILGHRTLRRIDVASIHGGLVVGKRRAVLQLGAYGPESRPIFYFKNPAALSEAPEFHLVQTLKEKLVLVPKNTDHNCLNFIRTYKSSYINTVIMVPFLGSLLVGIIWAIVAVTKYHQDVQASVQTAFSIASYIVTAGALLIALVAYLDSRYEASARDSLDVEESQPNSAAGHPNVLSTLPISALASSHHTSPSSSIGSATPTSLSSPSQAAPQATLQATPPAAPQAIHPAALQPSPATWPSPGTSSTQSLPTRPTAVPTVYHRNSSHV